MKTVLLTATYLVGVGELVLAIYFWATNQKNEIRRVMALLAFATGMWVLLSAAIAYQPENAVKLFLNDLIYVCGGFVLTAFLHFSIIYPYPRFYFDNLHATLLYVPAVLFSAIALTTRTIVSQSIGGETIAGQVVGGPVFPIYNSYYAILFLSGLCILIRKIAATDGYVRRNLKLVVFAFALGGLPAVYLDLVAPFLNLPNPNYLVANIATVVWLGTVTYIITRKA